MTKFFFFAGDETMQTWTHIEHKEALDEQRVLFGPFQAAFGEVGFGEVGRTGVVCSTCALQQSTLVVVVDGSLDFGSCAPLSRRGQKVEASVETTTRTTKRASSDESATRRRRAERSDIDEMQRDDSS